MINPNLRELAEATGLPVATGPAQEAAALGSGAGMVDAVEAVNLAAGIVAGKRGAAIVTGAEILHELQQRTLSRAADQAPRADQLLDHARRRERSGYRIGFTSGCFDLLHPGPISLLETARANCDRLAAGLNSDQNEMTRAVILASPRSVDAVTIFQDDSPLELIRQIRPKVLVKGRDYQPHEAPGADLLPAWSGQLLLLDVLPGYSTSSTLACLAGKESGQ